MAGSKALLLAAFGGRGTGKTAWVKQQIAAAKPPRLMIFDYKNDPALEGIGTPYRDLGEFIRSLKKPAFKSRYLVNHSGDIHAQFELFCLAAWQAGCLMMFVDELPEVTKANSAPPAWRKCVNVGREYKDEKTGAVKWLTIIGAGQRPAECDKSFIGNADIWHCGRLGNQADAKTMADQLGCDFRDLLKLPDLHWVERSVGQIEPTRGVLSFKSKNISAKAPARPTSLKKPA